MSRADPWHTLRRFTSARLALGRTGSSLPTEEVLRFGLAHAQARDAVHQPFDVETLLGRLTDSAFSCLTVHSAADCRATYLRRPDLGRRLSEVDHQSLEDMASPSWDIVFVVGDGLSSRAVESHALAMLLETRPRLEEAGLDVGPVVLARQARVALGDEIGALLKARAVVVLIGERPGLSSPDSLGIYMTWAPRVSRTDAERNCISNIRAEGLSYPVAARKLVWLLVEARRLGLSGIGLKDRDGDLEAWPDPIEHQ